MTKTEMLMDRLTGPGRMNKNCRSCMHLEFNEMTDEMYCKLNDYELIRLKRYKRRPDWCPLVTGQKGGKNESEML